MQGWIAGIIAAVMARFTAWLMARGLELIHGQEQKAVTNSQIDKRLVDFKAAYKAAFNGQPVTPDQKAELKRAIADFIRGTDSGGL